MGQDLILGTHLGSEPNLGVLRYSLRVGYTDKIGESTAKPKRSSESKYRIFIFFTIFPLIGLTKVDFSIIIEGIQLNNSIILIKAMGKQRNIDANKLKKGRS